MNFSFWKLKWFLFHLQAFPPLFYFFFVFFLLPLFLNKWNKFHVNTSWLLFNQQVNIQNKLNISHFFFLHLLVNEWMNEWQISPSVPLKKIKIKKIKNKNKQTNKLTNLSQKYIKQTNKETNKQTTDIRRLMLQWKSRERERRRK